MVGCIRIEVFLDGATSLIIIYYLLRWGKDVDMGIENLANGTYLLLSRSIL